ncbi:MAG: glycerophosphodiester phosphodiesterase [Methanobacteriota archaeon]
MILNIAHRGASGHAPENTLSAFRLAAKMGADAIELDVHLSKDGVPVVIHDGTLERTTTGAGLVKDRTVAELQKLEAGSWFSRDTRGERVPTLAEAFEAVPGMQWFAEVKTDELDYPGIEKAILDVSKGKGAFERCHFISFNEASLRIVKGLDRKARTSFTVEKPDPRRLREYADFADALTVRWGDAKPGLLREAEAEGLPVHVWTVNTRWAMTRVARRGVAGIITDYPDRLGRALAAL